MSTASAAAEADRAPRLVASDLDGTLLRSDDTISAATLETLEAVAAAGVPVVLVTGRPWRWLLPVLDQLPDRGASMAVAILANGAVRVALPHGQVQESRLLAPGDAADVVSRLLDALPAARFATEYGDDTPFGYEPAYSVRVAPPSARIEPVLALLDRPVAKLLCRSGIEDAEQMYALAAKACAGLPVTLTHSSMRDTLLEIGAVGADKGTELAAYAAELGVDPADVIAFGDQRNDLSMLRFAGHAVATANAHPEVLDLVDEVAPSNDDDGVATVLRRWF